MTLQQPLFMQPAVGDAAISDSAQLFRQYVKSQLTAGVGVGSEQGVLIAPNYAVTQRGAGANLSVDIATGYAYVIGDDVSNQGTYFCWNDGTVNVTGFTVPGAGTYHHRVELQVQDKLSNGAFSGYVAGFVAKLDTGGGLPAEDNSAITLATVDIPSGSSSITNSMINDYRQRIGPVGAVRTSDLARTHATSYSDDPALQLLNLQANAQYALAGNLVYTSANTPGDLSTAFRVSGGTTMAYSAWRVNQSGTVTGEFEFDQTGTPTSGGGSSAGGTNSSLMTVAITGTVFTGTAPAYAVLQWAQNSDSGTATTMKAGSFLRAARLA